MWNVIKEGVKRNKKVLITGLVIIVFILAVYFVSGQFYPIAVVNGKEITASRFWKNYRAAQFYYDNAVKAYQGDSPDQKIEKKDPIQLKAEVLNQMIEAELTDQAVRKEVGGDLDYLVNNKIQKFDSDNSLKQQAQVLYGMSFADFKNEVIIPQAERDILAGRFFLQDKKVEDWSAEARKSASVTIFSKELKWNGQAIEAVKN